MSAEATAWAWAMIEAGRTANHAGSLVLLRLANRADEDGKCWPSARRTARDTRVSEREVRRTLARFDADGMVCGEPRFSSNGARTTNLLRLQMTPLPPSQGGGGAKAATPLSSGQGGRDALSGPPLPAGQGELKRDEKKEKPPPAAPARRAADSGDLKALANTHGLTDAQALRFATAASKASTEQIDALRHELPVRLSVARDRAGLAITLAKLAAQGLLDDTTRPARDQLELTRRRRREEEERQRQARCAAEEARARRSREGPSQAEIEARAQLQKLRRKAGIESAS